MNRERFDSALEGLRRFGDADALRASEHLECAVEHAQRLGKRWSEQMCYCLRECLETIPSLFGQPKPNQPLGQVARQFTRDVTDAIDVARSPDALRGLVQQFEQELEEAETGRRHRIAQAMLTQAGAEIGSRHVDEFAAEWTSTVEGLNGILHGGEHSDEEALSWLARALELLAALVGPISSRLDEVDRLASIEKPEERDVQRLLELVADERLARYFYSKADSAYWLEALDARGAFGVPLRGDWHQGGLLIRVSARAPKLAKEIAARLVGDPHRAASIVVLGVVRELGSDATSLAVRVLSAPAFPDSSMVGHELETTLERWATENQSDTFPDLADVALEPRPDGDGGRVEGKFQEYQYARLVAAFVAGAQCQHLGPTLERLVFKLRRVAGRGGGFGISLGRDLVDSDERSDRDIGNALISGVRDGLRRLRDCGVDLDSRRRLLGAIDMEILIRLWAGHLSEEEDLVST